jgi:hypothetical protein
VERDEPRYVTFIYSLHYFSKLRSFIVFAPTSGQNKPPFKNPFVVMEKLNHSLFTLGNDKLSS